MIHLSECVLWCFLLQSLRTIFLCGANFTSINYQDMLQLWLIPKLQECSEDFFFQQDGAPPYFHFDVCAHLSANLPGCGFGMLLTMTLLFLPGLHSHLT